MSLERSVIENLSADQSSVEVFQISNGSIGRCALHSSQIAMILRDSRLSELLAKQSSVSIDSRANSRVEHLRLEGPGQISIAGPLDADEITLENALGVTISDVNTAILSFTGPGNIVLDRAEFGAAHLTATNVTQSERKTRAEMRSCEVREGTIDGFVFLAESSTLRSVSWERCEVELSDSSIERSAFSSGTIRIDGGSGLRSCRFANVGVSVDGFPTKATAGSGNRFEGCRLKGLRIERAFGIFAGCDGFVFVEDSRELQTREDLLMIGLLQLDTFASRQALRDRLRRIATVASKQALSWIESAYGDIQGLRVAITSTRDIEEYWWNNRPEGNKGRTRAARELNSICRKWGVRAERLKATQIGEECARSVVQKIVTRLEALVNEVLLRDESPKRPTGSKREQPDRSRPS